MVQDPNRSSFGLEPNVAAGLASLFWWVGGLVILLGKPPQQWVRFVAVQAIVLSVALAIVGIVIQIIDALLFAIHMWPIVAIIGIVWLVVWVAGVVLWLIATIQAFQGKAYRMPFLAQYADRFVPASASL
ncbi:MAG TPA: DUF4870 domain-containing protein [Candidatus Elarobacter sp.]|jgi:uncharacterized membrane protein|nr:DUF4870 domain-containing protein [Candidatus Elarobacter sp.]